jgi:opacity protein-like surface antigen
MRLVGSVIRSLAVTAMAASSAALAQTDEIQVYDASIASPGTFSVTFHNNYTPSGRKEADFPGGIVPNRALNGVVETAYGVSKWLELGLYLPLYSLTNDRRLLFNGGKLRALLVVPDAHERTFFYGVNFEFSFNARHWETTRNSAEIRPIVGARLGPVDVIFNPILDTSLNGIHQLDFAPAGRVAYNFSQSWAGALEHYADFGLVSGFEPVDRQSHTLFAVVDYGSGSTSVELGIGHGFTAASDRTVLKLIVTRDF